MRTIVAGASSTAANLPGYLSNYADALQSRYEVTGDEISRRASEDAFRRTVELPQVSTDAVVETAGRWGLAAMEREDWDKAAEAYRHGLQAADRLFRTQSSREHKEAWLRTISRLPANAAYTMIRATSGHDAVKVLESGRAALLSEALELRRADIEQLRRQGHEGLADRFVRAADRVAALDTPPTERSR